MERVNFSRTESSRKISKPVLGYSKNMSTTHIPNKQKSDMYPPQIHITFLYELIYFPIALVIRNASTTPNSAPEPSIYISDDCPERPGTRV